MLRESGFYWVKYNGEWEVMLWSQYYKGGAFWRCGDEIDIEINSPEELLKKGIEEIDERRIEREPPRIKAPHWEKGFDDLLDTALGLNTAIKALEKQIFKYTKQADSETEKANEHVKYAEFLNKQAQSLFDQVEVLKKEELL